MSPVPYECTLCGARFTGYGAKSGLDSHLEGSHPEAYLKQKNRYHNGGRGVQPPAETFNAAADEVDPAAVHGGAPE